MGKDNQSYYAQRAAEEMAAADRATGQAAASAHRELSLRYSLKVILPDSGQDNDEMRPIGSPRTASPGPAPDSASRQPAKRGQG